jgi:hypothetical protein
MASSEFSYSADVAQQMWEGEHDGGNRPEHTAHHEAVVAASAIMLVVADLKPESRLLLLQGLPGQLVHEFAGDLTANESRLLADDLFQAGGQLVRNAHTFDAKAAEQQARIAYTQQED